MTHRTFRSVAATTTAASALALGLLCGAGIASADGFGSLGGSPAQSGVVVDQGASAQSPSQTPTVVRPAAQIDVGQVGGSFDEIRVEMHAPGGVSATTAQVTVAGPSGTRTLTAPVTVAANLATVVVAGPVEPGSTVTVVLPGMAPASGAVSGVIGTDPSTSVQLGVRLAGGAAQLG